MILRDPYYNPTAAIHPGNSLRDELEFLQVSQAELSLRTGISEKHISQIIHGEAPITMETAMKLERALGGNPTASFWIAKQNSYVFTTARLVAEKQLAGEVEKAKKFTCYLELVKSGYIVAAKTWEEKANNLLKFFGVDSLAYIPQTEAVAFRQMKGEFNRESLAAWLRCGELDAVKIEVQEFSKEKVKAILPELKKMTRTEGKIEKKKIQELCASAGIAVVFTPYFKNTKVNGSSRWIGGKPVIQINTRGVYSDIFWFTLFHELGHILLHGSKDKFVDYDGGGKDAKEKEADKFSSNTLIPPEKYKGLVAQKSVSVEEAEKFAEEASVSMSILTGRLAHDGLLSWKNAAKFRTGIVIE
jgi:HTH-type transcriptional regulator/antitoxin HigA